MGENDELSVPVESNDPTFQLGMDTNRIWVNSVQAFMTQAHSLLVFREQNQIGTPDGPRVIAKNVASVIIPSDVLVEFHGQLTVLINQMGINGGDEPNAES